MNFTKIDANRLEQAAQKTPSSPLAAPDKEAVDLFRHSLHKHDEKDPQDQHDSGKDNAQEPEAHETLSPESRSLRNISSLLHRRAEQQASPAAQEMSEPQTAMPEKTTPGLSDRAGSASSTAWDHSRNLHFRPGQPAGDQEIHKIRPDKHEDPPPQLPTDSVASLFSQRMMPMAEPQPATSAAPLSEPALDHLVDQILVGRSADGGHEIRLHIDPKILPGTEIRIQQNQDGSLHVRLISNNATSFQTLVSSQDILQQRLENSGSQARVEVSSEAEAEHNDSRRRSRGYIDPADELPS